MVCDKVVKIGLGVEMADAVYVVAHYVDLLKREPEPERKTRCGRARFVIYPMSPPLLVYHTQTQYVVLRA